MPAPKPTIGGIKEASIVSEWSKKRARGERVPIDPPSFNADGSVTATARMGRIDSPAGRKRAQRERLAEEEEARAAAEAPVATATIASSPDAAPAATQAANAGESRTTRLKKKLLGMFGG